MPCITPLASGRELELGWITEFLKEMNGETPSYSQVDYNYWSRGDRGLDKKTEELCTKCLAMGEAKMAKMSPQLQYWWKRHQAHDDLREFREKIGLKNRAVPEGF